MAAQWDADGLGDDVEVWAIGYYSTMGLASSFAGENISPCLADHAAPEDSAFHAYDAGIDDVFIVDRQGQVRYELSVGVMDLGDSEHRDTVDGWVRDLL